MSGPPPEAQPLAAATARQPQPSFLGAELAAAFPQLSTTWSLFAEGVAPLPTVPAAQPHPLAPTVAPLSSAAASPLSPALSQPALSSGSSPVLLNQRSSPVNRATASAITSDPDMLSSSPSAVMSEVGKATFTRTGPPVIRRLSSQDVPSSVDGLQALAEQGSWRAIIEKIKEVKSTGPNLQPPHEQLLYTAYHVLALVKLRMYGAAADELQAQGDLGSAKYSYESWPSSYPSKQGSMVPFALRLLHAELPHRLGHTATTIDRLYALLAHCNAKLDELGAAEKSKLSLPAITAATSADVNIVQQSAKQIPQAAPVTSPPASGTLDTSALAREAAGMQIEEDAKMSRATSSPTASDIAHFTMRAQEEAVSRGHEDLPEDVRNAGPDEAEDGNERRLTTLVPPLQDRALKKWRKRQEIVIFSVLNHHLAQRDFLVALQWLGSLVEQHPGDPVIQAKYGYVQLQMGDLEGAKATFMEVEQSAGPTVALVYLNRGLLHFATKQYSAALVELDAALKLDPDNVVAVNNKALCLMYGRDLLGAIGVLEGALQRSPLVSLQETLILDLCSMYELASADSGATKRLLAAWLARLAPDDFDLSCTRL
eukprot:SM000314S12190  [mRNA]  locus=s314:71966:75505:- [translate_table: standard]